MEKVLKEFRALCLASRNDPATQKGYTQAVKAMILATGERPTYRSILWYVLMKSNQVGIGRLRYYKSAAKACMYHEGRPLKEEENEDLDRILEGLECLKTQKARKRGAPTAEDVKLLVKRALDEGAKTEALAIAVGFGVGMRPRDLLACARWAVDIKAGVVWVERKCRRLSKVRKGAYEPRPIGTQKAYWVLHTRVQSETERMAKIFPGLSLTRITTIVQKVSAEEFWDPELLWTGAHNLRHGRAADVYKEGMKAVRAAGSWGSDGAAMTYALPNEARVCPLERSASKPPLKKPRKE